MPHATATTVENFDVLLYEETTSAAAAASASSTSSSQQQQQLRLVPNATHIGNNRFQVLLAMHKNEYETCVQNDQSTIPICERILNIVCRQTNGRFLLQIMEEQQQQQQQDPSSTDTTINDSSTCWKVLTITEAMEFCQQQLDQEIERTLSTSSNTSSTTTTAAPAPVNHHRHHQRHHHHQAAPAAVPLPPQQRSSLLISDYDVLDALEPLPLPEPSSMFSASTQLGTTTTTSNNMNNNNNKMDFDFEDRKRRRRSSLLRRSISETALFVGDKKKNMRRQSNLEDSMAAAALMAASALEEESSDDISSLGAVTNTSNLSPIMEWNQLPARRRSSVHRRPSRILLRSGSDEFQTTNTTTTTAEALDVIFQSTSHQLVPNHTGNNRLEVLINVQLSSYATTVSNEQRFTMVQGLQDTVSKHWGGRFLMEETDHQHLSTSYHLLSEEDTTNRLLQNLNERVAASASPTATDSASSSGHRHHHSFSHNQHHRPQRPRFGLLRSVSEGRRPSTVKRETLHALHQQVVPAVAAAAGATSSSDIRQSALQSLQQKKKRLGLKSRLRNLAFHTRNALTRGTSEPIYHPRQQQQRSTSMPPDSLGGGGSMPSLDNTSTGSGWGRESFLRSQSAPVGQVARDRRHRHQNDRNTNNTNTVGTAEPRDLQQLSTDLSEGQRNKRLSLAELQDLSTDLSEGQINDLLSTMELENLSSDLAVIGGDSQNNRDAS